MKMYLFFVFLTFFILSSCQKDQLILGPPSGDSFFYQSRDTLGQIIVSGWISLVKIDSSQMEGSWKLEKIKNRTDIGPQAGSGELKGWIIDNELFVNLQPNFRDNNLLLNGILKGNTYSGIWQWISFKGITNWGTFQAVKK